MRFTAALVTLISVAVIAGSSAFVLTKDYPPGLSVNVSGVPGYVYYGRPYEITIGFTNHGGPIDGPLELAAELPPAFSLRGDTAQETRDGQRVVWHLGGLGTGESGSMPLTLFGTLPSDRTGAVNDLPGYEGHIAFVDGFVMRVTLTGGSAASTALAVADTGVAANPWCEANPGVDDDGDCTENASDVCPDTADEDRPGDPPSPGGYSWADGYYDDPDSSPDSGAADGYGCSKAQIDDDDLDHLCDTTPFVVNDRCYASYVDSCPDTPSGDLPPSKALYTWGDGYPGGGTDSGGLDSYGCSLLQIQDDDLDHFCDNDDFTVNDRCWEGPDQCDNAAEDFEEPNPSDGCPLQIDGFLEVRKFLWPLKDKGRFNLWVDGEKEASNAGNGGTTGELTVEPGEHAVKETGSSLSKYFTSVTCRDEDGSGDVVFSGIGPGPHTVDVGGGADVVCVFRNVRKPGS